MGLLTSENITCFEFKIKSSFAKDRVEIKDIELESIIINDKKSKKSIQIKINPATISNFSCEGLVNSEDILIPNIDIKVPIKHNCVTKCSKIKYKNLNIIFNGKNNKVNITILGFSINPFFTKDFDEYIKILKHLKHLFSFKGVDDFLDELIKLQKDSEDFKNRLIEKKLFKDKYNDVNILKFFYAILYNVPKRKSQLKNRIISEHIDDGKYGILYEGNDKCNILHCFPSVEIKRPDDTTVKGPLAWFLLNDLVGNDNITRSWRNCITFDYMDVLDIDRVNLENHYLDGEVGQIVLNYLLIYWENNHSEEMLRKLLSIIEPRIKTTQNDIIKFNGLQINKILEKPFNDEEVEYLSHQYDKTDKKIIKLCYNILLGRKVESKRLYNKLNTEDSTKFQQWPIYYLYKKL